MAICKRCGNEVAFIARNGLCQSCSEERIIAAAIKRQPYPSPDYLDDDEDEEDR